jgi:hypothetical protein
MTGPDHRGAFARAAARYQEFAPLAGLTGTLCGIFSAFQDPRLWTEPLSYYVPSASLLECIAVTALSGVAVFAVLLIAEFRRS